MTNRSKKMSRRLSLAAAASLLATLVPFGPASAAVDLGSGCTDLGTTVECEFWAEFGSVLLDGNSANIAGYATSDGGSPELPGPVIVADEGDTVQVTLHNNLSEDTGMSFRGQGLPSDFTGVAPGGSGVYTFVAAEPGTYSYGAGLLSTAAAQSAMGLYGALVVRPATAGQAYAGAASAYDVEHVVVLSEVDLDLTSANMASFDMRDFEPEFYLINGQVAPDIPNLGVAAGEQMLLRYVNAGVTAHSMGLLGLEQTVIAQDGNELGNPRTMVAETLGSGQTQDVVVSVPAQADGLYSLYDTGLWLMNRQGSAFGGMFTFVEVTPGAPGADTTGPATSNVEYTSSVITATVNDAATGGSTVVTAEYFIDTIGSPGTGTAMTASDLAFDEVTEDVTATVTSTELATLNTGSHTLYVRGQDSAGNWGAVSSLFTSAADSGAPVTTGLLLVPSVSNGTGDVLLRATGDDSASGGSDVVAGEYFFDSLGLPGTGYPMAPNVVGPIVALDTVIPAADIDALSEGDHNVLVRSSDGQWGDAALVVLTVDKTGPDTTSVTVNPAITNGTIGVNSSVAAVRMSAAIADPNGVAAAEGFIDTVGSDGTGISMYPSDGVFNSTSEFAIADIPLSTIALLPDGTHTVYVHGRDVAGNWGAIQSVDVLVDTVAPEVSGLAATPNPADGTTAVTVSATAADSASAVVAAEWFAGADPGIGNAVAMTITGTGPYSLETSVDPFTLGNGDHVVGVRVRDAAGNWSTTASVTLTVDLPAPPAAVWYFSTAGNAPVPGVTGGGDSADIYTHDAGVFDRLFDATAVGVPGGANLDGVSVEDADTFYVSFTADVTLPGIGTVRDEDVVLYDAGTWSVFFEGSNYGLTGFGQDVVAIDVTGGVLYFSTLGNAPIPGVGGPYDNADIYSWDGADFARVWDATANGVAGNAAIDGMSFVDATHFYVTFVNNTTLPDVGGIQDEDIVFFDGGTWTLFFDGTAAGLTNAGHDLDSIDVP